MPDSNYKFDPVKMGRMFERVDDIHDDMKKLIDKVDTQNGRVGNCELSLKDKVDIKQYTIDQKDTNKKLAKIIIVVILLASGAEFGVEQIIKFFVGG